MTGGTPVTTDGAQGAPNNRRLEKALDAMKTKVGGVVGEVMTEGLAAVHDDLSQSLRTVRVDAGAAKRALAAADGKLSEVTTAVGEMRAAKEEMVAAAGRSEAAATDAKAQVDRATTSLDEATTNLPTTVKNEVDTVLTVKVGTGEDAVDMKGAELLTHIVSELDSIKQSAGEALGEAESAAQSAKTAAGEAATAATEKVLGSVSALRETLEEAFEVVDKKLLVLLAVLSGKLDANDPRVVAKMKEASFVPEETGPKADEGETDG